MALYELSDQNIKDIRLFLSKTVLQGDQAINFVLLLQALNNPVVTQPVKPKKVVKPKKA